MQHAPVNCLLSVADKNESDLTVQSIDSTDTTDIENKAPDTGVNTEVSSDQQNSEVSSTTDSGSENQTIDNSENLSVPSPVKQSSSNQSSIPEPSSR